MPSKVSYALCRLLRRAFVVVVLLTQLLTSFSSQTGDWTTIRQLDWFIAPLLNPDGYAYSHHEVSRRATYGDKFAIDGSLAAETA